MMAELSNWLFAFCAALVIYFALTNADRYDDGDDNE